MNNNSDFGKYKCHFYMFLSKSPFKIALSTNLTQSLGGVEFQIDSVNNKGQYSIDGGTTWQNFSQGEITQVSLQHALSGVIQSTSRSVYCFDLSYDIGSDTYTGFVAYVTNINPRPILDCNLATINGSGSSFSITTKESVKVNGTTYASGQTITSIGITTTLTIEKV